MEKNTIILRWKENGSYYQRELDKKVLNDYMDSTSRLFYYNNEISSKVLEVLKRTVAIEINKDRNSDMQQPIVDFILDDGTEKCIEINRKHTIMCDVFNQLCVK